MAVSVVAFTSGSAFVSFLVLYDGDASFNACLYVILFFSAYAFGTQQTEAQVEVGARFWNWLALEAKRKQPGTHAQGQEYWQATVQSQGPGDA